MATFTGDDGPNTIFGSSGDDTLNGLGGNDNLQAGAGNDSVLGAAGNDTVSGNDGIDWVAGGAGNDTVAGGAGQDHFLFAEAGAANADRLTDFASTWDDIRLDLGGFSALGAAGRFVSGDVRFFSGAGASSGHDADDRIVFNSTTHQLFYDADGNGAGAAQLIATLANGQPLIASDLWVFGTPPSSGAINGTPGDDSLVGTAADETLNGFAGNDTLDGGGGSNLLNGGDGNDTYVLSGNDTITDSSGIDTVIVTSSSYLLGAGLENLVLRGSTSRPDGVQGTGNALDNHITSEIPDTPGQVNFIDGASGSDTLVGGAGSEFFSFVQDGSDSVDGGGGFDWLSLSEASVADLRAGTLTSASGSAVLAGIEAVSGSAGNDRIVASDAGVRMLAYAGDDTLIGGAGNDSLSGDALFDAPADPLGNDSLLGGAGDDELNGMRGNDTLDGGTGNDTLTGGNDADAFRFTAAPGTANADTINDFESGLDKLHLDASVMTTLGASGNFVAGDGRFYAAAGASAGHDVDDRVVYDSSSGNLWYDADGSGATTAELIATLQTWNGSAFVAPPLAATDLVVDNGTSGGPGQSITGTSGADSLTGGAGNDTINAGTGDDTLVGGSGDDQLNGQAGRDSLDGGTGNDTLNGGGDQDHFAFSSFGTANADHVLNFASAWDDIRFDEGAFAALGATGRFASGDVRFFSAAGATAGHDADDRIVYNTTTGQLFYDADGNGTGAAQLIATLDGVPALAASDLWAFGTPGGGGGGNVINGTEGNDSLVGTAADETLNGFGGNDTLDGQGGNNVLNGGTGDDTYRIGDGFDTVNDAGGIDSVIADVTHRSSLSLAPGIENLTLTGSPIPESEVFGNDLDNLIVDQATPGGSFSISGGGGNDTIVGSASSERFFSPTGSTGEAGHDVIDGGGGFDLLFVNNGNAVIDFSTGTAHDATPNSDVRFSNIEEGVTGSGNDLLIAGNAGSSLFSQGGDDTFVGGAGNDTMTAGLRFDFPEQVLGNDSMSGGGGNDVMEGDRGNDTLDGGAGNDSLSGGGDADAFVFSVAPGAANADSIRDFESGLDKIHLDASVMNALGTSGAFSPGDARFFAGAGANSGHDADDRVVFNTTTGQLWYDADGSGSGSGAAQLIATVGASSGTPTPNVGTVVATDIVVDNGTAGGETVNGTAGDDTLTGGDGNDTVFGGTGNDTLNGGAGDDQLNGQAGNDSLDGQTGNDTLNGGGDMDHFAFSSFGAPNADHVLNFASAWDDIRFDEAAFTALGATGRFAAGDVRFFAGAGASGGHDADDRMIYDTSTGQLYYDADGSGAGEAQIVATFAGHPALAATDITVI